MQPPLFRRRWLVLAALAIQFGCGGYLLIDGYRSARRSWYQYGGGAPKSPLHGVWNIDTMTIDGHTRSPLVTDYGRWRRVLFQQPTAMSFQRMNDTFLSYGAKINMDSKIIVVTAGSNNTLGTFTFTRPDPSRLILDGSLDGHAIHMETTRFDPNAFPLLSRGFNWIQERPFNR
jgi:hypothetical protein